MPRSIAIIRQSYRRDGGAERFVSRLLPVLASSGLSPTLIARNWEPVAGADLDIVRCDPFHWGRLTRDLGFAHAAKKICRRNRFDLIQTHERISGCDIFRAGDGLHCRWLACRRRTQSAIERLTTWLSPYHRYVLWAEKRLIQDERLLAIICNSEMVRREIQQVFAIPGDKLHVIYNGIDTSYFHPRVRAARSEYRRDLGLPLKAPIFVLVGSGFERKGLSIAIDAVATVPEAHLLVAGKSKRIRRYVRRARQRGCENRIHFIGPIDDVRHIYGLSDGLLLPTAYDPFPNVILEAMACGIPVVTTTNCGGQDIVIDGVNGFLRSIEDQNGIDDAIRMLTNRNVAETMGRAAREAAASLTLDRMQNELSSLYRRLLAETDR